MFLHGRSKKINMLRFAELLEGKLETTTFEPREGRGPKA